MLYCICYDLNSPGRDYSGLIEAIKTYGTWWHHLDSTWFVKSTQSAKQINDFLSQYIDTNDELLVFPVGIGWWSRGFSQRAIEWLHNNWNK